MEHVCTSSSFLCFRQVDSPHEQKKKKINKKKKENKISTQEIFAQSATQRLQVTAEKMIGLQDDAYAAGRGGNLPERANTGSGTTDTAELLIGRRTAAANRLRKKAG